ncbi:EAL domain-containing protein [Sphingomonas sp. S1-29]|uniref:putative bifunctional diguanylate cyclase/phosphodiesterase n=1 Tax=Sphingomonas sp. S1-29 TaxID=2991074 RepID=UPI00223F0B56|nr:EAL domain-containing protein [Sphingomonas sp. S1-29]UZK69517.1 EAL domain-containing protein [Sphingomonas sp. S1-29]
MHGFSLTSRATLFAICAGAAVFAVSLAAGANLVGALAAASGCAMLCWAAGRQVFASYADSLDAAIQRLARATNGDLLSAIPPEVGRTAPALAGAMDGLFRQLHGNFEHVHRLAMYDPVTALPNRISFQRSCEAMLAAGRPGDISALFFIDLDRFKAVNDTLGHANGDLLLGMVADRIRGIADRHAAKPAKAQPLIGRLAGDEFTMFFPALTDAEESERIGRAIQHALSQPFALSDQEVRIGASIGIAIRPQHGAALDDLMRAADAAMYHAKATGRGRAEYFTETLAAEIATRARLESDLREAMAKRQFSLVFQPQVSAQDGHIVGAEALLRWQHPEGEKLPAAFIQRAEETGLIVEIGEWVVESVAATIARWAQLGIEKRMAVNISPRQIDHAHFFRRLRAAMHNAQAPATLLELEISETLAMTCSDEVIAAIEALRADGATIAIDDFGTGYSNLARLRALPVDRVKLDRSLIENVATHHEARIIAQAVISLIHGLNCEAVAEGIESAAQAQVLRIIGCDVLQGYAVARPMPEDIFLAWAQTPRMPLLSRAFAG